MSSLQQRIFEGLERQLGEEHSAVKWLEQSLGLDRSTARRKLTGESKLSMEQLEVLLEHYPTVVESMLPQSFQANSFIGSFTQLEKYESIIDYLRGVITRFEFAAKRGATLKYVARDLPLFFFLAERDLASYKFAMWTGELNARHPHRSLNLEAYQLCKEAFSYYAEIDTEEIWNKHIMRNQYHQIRWHHAMTYIDNAFRDRLFDVLSEQIAAYKQWSCEGAKSGGGALQLYFTDFMTMNNGGLLVTEKTRVLMAALSSVNFVSYLNPMLCEAFEREFEMQKNSSILVSNSNALERERCFEEIVSGLEATI